MTEQQRIVLFDGECNLCNWAVQLIIRHDPSGKFQFAALQSPIGEALLKQHGIAAMKHPTNYVESVVLIEDGRAYTHSTAALRTVRHFTGLWPALYAFMIVPRPIRDVVYRLIARSRYRVFGRRDSCMIPTPALKQRFLS